MDNAYVETGFIRDLYAYLMATTENEIIVRTTHVKTGQGWHDDEFDANQAGFRISRFIYPEYVKKHEFAECYYLQRK